MGIHKNTQYFPRKNQVQAPPDWASWRYLKHDDLTGSLHIRNVKTDNGIEIDKEGNLIVDNKLCIKADIDNEGKYYNINKTGKYNFLEFKGENYYCFSKNKVILDSYAVYATLKNSIDSRLNTLSLETTPDTNGSRQPRA